MDSGVVSRRPRKSKSSTVEPGPPAVHLESAEASHTSDATTCLATPLSTDMADSGEARQPKSLRRSKLRTAAYDTSAVNSESHKAGNVADTPELPTAPSTAPLISEVADRSMALRVKSSRKSKSNMSKPEALAAHLGSLEATHLPNAHGPASTPLRSDAEDSGVVLRPKRSRTTKSGPVTPEAAQEHLESSEVSDSVLRPESSRKNRSNIRSPESRETRLESLKSSPSRASPAVVELGAPEASTHGPSSRRSTRSASDVGSKNAKLTSSVVVSKQTEFHESFSSSSASIGNIESQQLLPLVVGSDVTPTTSQSGSDVDAVQEPGNVVPVSKLSRRRTKSAVVLYSGSESQDATDITSDDSTAHSESAELPPTRRTRRQAARSRLSLKKVSAANLSGAESVTSTSSCEAWASGLTEMSLPKQEVLGKQASVVEPTSSSKVGRSTRFRANSCNAPLSLSSESTNTAELGGTSAMQEVAQAAKSGKSEVKVRSSSRISASKLALRSKIRKDKSEGEPSGSELQNDNCAVGESSRICAPAFDTGVASTASADVVTSNGSSLDSASCSTSFAKLVSNHSGTRLVSSGLQVTSSSMSDMVVSIEEPGGPETVGAHERPISMTPRLSSPSSRREVGGLPIRSSKSRKRTGLPEAPDPRIQELLVTYERLTITTSSELSGDDSDGIKRPSVAQPSASLNLLDVAGSGDMPQETQSSGAAGSVWKEGTEKCGSDGKHEAKPSYSSNIVTRESVSANAVSSSNMCEVADASVLMEGATERKENSPESLPAPPVPNSAARKPDVTDSNKLPCSLSTSSDDVTPKKSEASLLHTKQHQCDVPACDVPVSGNITVLEVTTNKPSIEPAAPEEVNASDLTAASSPAAANRVADFGGPEPVGPLQGNNTVISVHEVKVSDPVAKPDIPDVARTDAPVDKLLHDSDDRKVPSPSHSRPVSTPSNVAAEPLTALMSSDFDSSSSSAISTAIEHSRPRVVSPNEQGSSGLRESHHAVQECLAADPVDEFNWSLESDQNLTEGCSGEASDMAGALEVVASPCGQIPEASHDDGLPKAEASSHAGSEEATAERASGVDSVNSAEVSSADEEFPEDDAEWILLDEVRDDSAELFSSPEESIVADCSDSCGDDTNVENSAPASEVNCVKAGVSKKKDIVDMIDDIGDLAKDVMDSASNEKGVHQDSIEHCCRESESKSVESVCKGSSIDANRDTACGGPVENINCVDDVPSENSVVHSDSESCSEAASSAEQFTISSETLANNNCEEILRNIGSDTSMIDVDSESFLEPASAKRMGETAEEDCADITSADLVHDFSSGNCDGDIGSEGMEFFASENFIEDIGSEESMELFSGSDSESKNQRDAVAFDKSNDDSRQHEDVSAMVAAGKSARVVVERLDNIDASSAIGMLYHQAKKALKYNRASCKAVKISKSEHEGRPDSSEPHHTSIEEKDKIVGRSTARKSSVSHQQTLKPSKSLHKDVEAPSSQSRERRSSDSQAQHRSPREQDSSVKPVSAGEAPASEKTSKFSKISRKSLSASGSRHSWDDPHAQHAHHANTGKHDGSVGPFSEDKSSSSAKLSSESSKVLHKGQLDTHKQHLKKSTHGLKAKPPGAKKKGQSANPLSVEKSSNGSQKASASSKTLSQNFKVTKTKGSDASLKKAEAQQAVAAKKGDGVDPCSLGKSLSHDQEASKSSKTSRRDIKVAKNKGRDANISKAETQHTVTEKIGGSVDSHLLEKLAEP
ncbi:hypothetical protein HPB50_003456 [Hyalomma asiaticum]|uniref:Uncharacterized protein n=1 Tax=Hyalomma asiaticum TaxID=266040 RepID=A0ACB7RXL3_HYAAI|nr:hypothetical protein HPB50_003456 [Hyalomma asiaticum]